MRNWIKALVVVLVAIVVLRFGVVPNLGGAGGVVAASCTLETFDQLADRTDFVLMGTATSEWNSIFTSEPYTYTKLENIEIIEGSYPDREIILRQLGGCDIVTGLCVYTSVRSAFTIGDRYLMFLAEEFRQPDGSYEGFSLCGGKYTVADGGVEGFMISEEGEIIELTSLAEIRRRLV